MIYVHAMLKCKLYTCFLTHSYEYASFELWQRWLEKRKLNIIELNCMLCSAQKYTASRSNCKLSLPTVPSTPRKACVSSAKLMAFDAIISVNVTKQNTNKKQRGQNSALWNTTNHWSVLTNTSMASNKLSTFRR